MPDDFKEPLAACVCKDKVDVDLDETEHEAPPFEPEIRDKFFCQKYTMMSIYRLHIFKYIDGYKEVSHMETLFIIRD